MKKTITPFFLVLSMITWNMISQVGINTTSPNALLTIDTDSRTEAALELVPQSAPTTSLSAGQLAVIGDELYLYDATRSKWLTVANTAIQFGRNGDTDTQSLHFGGNMVSGTAGALMPFDGTIVYISAMAASGDDTDINLRARNASNTNSINETFTLSSLRYSDTTANLDFNAGDYLTVRARDATTTAVDVTVIFWVKWRQ